MIHRKSKVKEKDVGEGVRQAMDEYGLKREDIFVSTKLWNDNRGYDKAMKAFESIWICT